MRHFAAAAAVGRLSLLASLAGHSFLKGGRWGRTISFCFTNMSKDLEEGRGCLPGCQGMFQTDLRCGTGTSFHISVGIEDTKTTPTSTSIYDRRLRLLSVIYSHSQ